MLLCLKLQTGQSLSAERAVLLIVHQCDKAIYVEVMVARRPHDRSPLLIDDFLEALSQLVPLFEMGLGLNFGGELSVTNRAHFAILDFGQVGEVNEVLVYMRGLEELFD